MHNLDATEIAYKNGYEQGKKDAVKHGWWYWDVDSETGHNLRRCSECHSGSGWARNYCAECGTKMDVRK